MVSAQAYPTGPPARAPRCFCHATRAFDQHTADFGVDGGQAQGQLEVVGADYGRQGNCTGSLISSLFLAIEQLLFKGFPVGPWRRPEAALLGFQQAFGQVAQGFGVVLLQEVSGRRVEHIGIGQRLVVVIVDQVRGGVEGEQVVDRRRQLEGTFIAMALGPSIHLGFRARARITRFSSSLRVRMRGRSVWL